MNKELMRTYSDCKCIRDVYQILNGYAEINDKKAINEFILAYINDTTQQTVSANLRYIWGNGLSDKFCKIFDLQNLKTFPKSKLLEKVLTKISQWNT